MSHNRKTREQIIGAGVQLGYTREEMEEGLRHVEMPAEEMIRVLEGDEAWEDSLRGHLRVLRCAMHPSSYSDYTAMEAKLREGHELLRRMQTLDREMSRDLDVVAAARAARTPEPSHTIVGHGTMEADPGFADFLRGLCAADSAEDDEEEIATFAVDLADPDWANRIIAHISSLRERADARAEDRRPKPTEPEPVVVPLEGGLSASLRGDAEGSGDHAMLVEQIGALERERTTLAWNIRPLVRGGRTVAYVWVRPGEELGPNAEGILVGGRTSLGLRLGALEHWRFGPPMDHESAEPGQTDAEAMRRLAESIFITEADKAAARAAIDEVLRQAEERRAKSAAAAAEEQVRLKDKEEQAFEAEQEAVNWRLAESRRLAANWSRELADLRFPAGSKKASREVVLAQKLQPLIRELLERGRVRA